MSCNLVAYLNETETKPMTNAGPNIQSAYNRCKALNELTKQTETRDMFGYFEIIPVCDDKDPVKLQLRHLSKERQMLLFDEPLNNADIIKFLDQVERFVYLYLNNELRLKKKELKA